VPRQLGQEPFLTVVRVAAAALNLMIDGLENDSQLFSV